MAEDTSKIPGIVIDREEQRRALGRVYSLLLRLAAQREAAGDGIVSESGEPSTTGNAPVSLPDRPEA